MIDCVVVDALAAPGIQSCQDAQGYAALLRQAAQAQGWLSLVGADNIYPGKQNAQLARNRQGQYLLVSGRDQSRPYTSPLYLTLMDIDPIYLCYYSKVVIGCQYIVVAYNNIFYG